MSIQFPLLKKLDKPTHWVLGLIAVGLLAAGATIYLVVERTQPKSDGAELTVPVKAENLKVRSTASGSVVPVQSVNLSPKIAGRVAELYVEQGDRVKQGQVIARMDDADIQAQQIQSRARLAQSEARLAEVRAGSRPEEIAQVRAQVEAAQAKLNLTSSRVAPYRYLVQEGVESRDRLEEVLTEDRTAKANLREAQQKLKQLQNGPRPEEIARVKAEVATALGELQAVEVQQEDTVIRAPFASTVTQKYATKGAFVAPTTSASSTTSATSTSIVAIAEGLEIIAKVPEVDIKQIKPGQSVEIVADAYPDQVFKGIVRLVAPVAVVEQNVTSFQVRVTVKTGKASLRSGMNVDVTFLGETVANALVVPTVAIATQSGQTGVFVPDQKNEPQFRPVAIGQTIQDQTQILKGLKSGEQVFVDFPEDRNPEKEAKK